MKKRYERELSEAELAVIADDDIDISDIPELDDEFWQNARLVQPHPSQAPAPSETK